MFWYLVLAVVVLVLVAFYKYATSNNDFFEKKGIPFKKPYFLVGHNGALFTQRLDLFEMVQERFNSREGNKVLGFFDFTNPNLMIADPDLAKQLFVKHFENFTDHRVMIDGNQDAVFGKSLIALRGQEWRDMRATLSPAFTGSKIRQMFELVSECADQTAQFFVEKLAIEGRQVHEVKEIFTRFANDVIATSAFGIKVDSLRDRENSFYMTGFKLINANTIKVIFKFIGIWLMPKVMKFLNIELFPPGTKNFFLDLVIGGMDYREKNNVHRPDIIDLLMQARKGNLTHQSDEQESSPVDGFATVTESSVGKAVVKKQWDNEHFAAQCFLFFIAGFETISTALSFLAYELAVNKDIQERLYEEILAVNANLEGKPITYEVLQKMTYLDMVVSESLRRWPPVPSIERICTKDVVFKDADSGLEVSFEKDMSVFVPVAAFHLHPAFFPNPEKFDPERFNEENKKDINLSTYLPFGLGPRNCIGSRFALMEMKALIYHLLLSLSFEVCEKTQVPLKRAKGAKQITEKGVWLEFKARV